MRRTPEAAPVNSIKWGAEGHGPRGLTLAPGGAILGPTLTGGNSWPKSTVQP